MSKVIQGDVTYKTIEGEDFVTVILLYHRPFVQPPRPFAHERCVSRHKGGQPEEELRDVIMEEVAEKRGDLDSRLRGVMS